MSRILSVGVSNLRTLRAIEPITLAPITVLLGKNSVGKSTFARIFPLLRQSVESKKRAPILWYGNAIDFGSLSQAVSHGESDITFRFEIQCDDDNSPRGIINSAAGDRMMALGVCKLHVTLTQDPADDVTYAKEVILDAVGCTLTLKFSKPTGGVGDVQILIDGVAQRLPQNAHIYSSQGTFLPRLAFLQRSQDGSKYEWRPNPWSSMPVSVLRGIIHGNTAPHTVERIAARLLLASPPRLVTQMKTIGGPASWKAFINDDGRAALYSTDLVRSLLISSCEKVIDRLDGIIAAFFQGVRYLKPLRATAERYYRQVDLAVSEVDPDGSNFAMFLSSLGHELGQFQNFVQSHLGIGINVTKEGEQVSVVAKSENDSRESNIADMGFGISQVLPLAAQLWLSHKPRWGQTPSTVVVLEQPELHLHPDMQSRLADLFSAYCKATANEQNTGKCLIVETHSEALVERLGQLVERGDLHPSAVKVLLFEPSSQPNDTSVRVSRFDPSGVLENWPYGFFDPELR